MPRIVRIDPEGVMVRVSALGCIRITKCPTTVGRDVQRHAQDIEAAVVVWVHTNLAEIEGARTDIVSFCPRLATVVRTKDAAGLDMISGSCWLPEFGISVEHCLIGLHNGVGCR